MNGPEEDLEDTQEFDAVIEEVPVGVDDDWHPEGYEPGPDEPGDIHDECGGI